MKIMLDITVDYFKQEYMLVLDVVRMTYNQYTYINHRTACSMHYTVKQRFFFRTAFMDVQPIDLLWFIEEQGM